MGSACATMLLKSFIGLNLILAACTQAPKVEVVRQSLDFQLSEPIRIERDSTDTTARLYLTFDDGPYRTTPGLMQLLDKKQIRANFFVIGAQIQRSAWHDSVFHAVKAHPNFFVYNHTYSHAITDGRLREYYRDPVNVWQDIQKNRSFLKEGVIITRLPAMNTWRTPGRTSYTDRMVKPFLKLLDSLNEPEFIVGWNVEWTQETGKSRLEMERLIRQIEHKLSISPKNARDVVILLHDYLFRTPESLALLGDFIDHFQKRKDVKFDWIHHLPGMSSGVGL